MVGGQQDDWEKGQTGDAMGPFPSKDHFPVLTQPWDFWLLGKILLPLGQMRTMTLGKNMLRCSARDYFKKALPE